MLATSTLIMLLLTYLLEVFERVGKSVIWVCERAHYGLIIKWRNCSIFVIDSYLTDSALTAVKSYAKF